MRICPKCRSTYAVEVRTCPIDGWRPVARADYDAGGTDPLLGSTLAERFTVVGRLGSGGMGTVYRAEQSPIGREVALKVLRRDLGRDPETVARFQREARALSQLKHPNTVTIFDFGQTDDGLLYLAMEMLEGEMLSARLKATGPLDVVESIRIATGVLRSLNEAHARGIIHRDLKPDNIFLAKLHGRPDEAELVKVVDFGIAKIRQGDVFPGLDPVATQEGTVFGTPRYMSPEQAQGKTLDGRSDLYAVGVLLFHMLTGAAPFTDDDAVIVMAHHIKSVPPLVRKASPDRPIPASLEALVACALAKDPGDRPQTAETFLAALESAIVDARAMGAVGSVPPASGPQHRPSPLRRPWITALAAGALVIGVVCGFSLLATRRGRPPLTAAVARVDGLPTHMILHPAAPSRAGHGVVALPAPPAPAPRSPAGPLTPTAPALDLVQDTLPAHPTAETETETAVAVPASIALAPGALAPGAPAASAAPLAARVAPAGAASLARSRRRRSHRTAPTPAAAPPPVAPAGPAPAPTLYHRWND